MFSFLPTGNRTFLHYLREFLSGEVGFSCSCQPHCVYPSQNIFLNPLPAPIKNFQSFQSYDLSDICFPVKWLLHVCIYPSNLLERLLCHCSNRFPGNQRQVRVRAGGREGGEESEVVLQDIDSCLHLTVSAIKFWGLASIRGQSPGWGEGTRGAKPKRSVEALNHWWGKVEEGGCSWCRGRSEATSCNGWYLTTCSPNKQLNSPILHTFSTIMNHNSMQIQF